MIFVLNNLGKLLKVLNNRILFFKKKNNKRYKNICFDF